MASPCSVRWILGTYSNVEEFSQYLGSACTESAKLGVLGNETRGIMSFEGFYTTQGRCQSVGCKVAIVLEYLLKPLSLT